MWLVVPCKAVLCKLTFSPFRMVYGSSFQGFLHGVKGHFICPTVTWKECRKNGMYSVRWARNTDCTKIFSAMVFPACPFAVSSVQSPQAFPLNSPTSPLPDWLGWLPEALRGWEEAAHKCGHLFAALFSPHCEVTVPQLSWIRERNWNWFAHGSVWVNVDPRLKHTELLRPSLAGDTHHWVHWLTRNAAGLECSAGAQKSDPGQDFRKGKSFSEAEWLPTVVKVQGIFKKKKFTH